MGTRLTAQSPPHAVQRSQQISAGNARRSGHAAHGTEPPTSLPLGPSATTTGRTPSGLITMHAVDNIAPRGLVDPIRVRGGPPAVNHQAITIAAE
jgi:hypothetical protein